MYGGLLPCWPLMLHVWQNANVTEVSNTNLANTKLPRAWTSKFAIAAHEGIHLGNKPNRRVGLMFSLCSYLSLTKLRNITSFQGDKFLHTGTGLRFLTEICKSLKGELTSLRWHHSDVADKTTRRNLSPIESNEVHVSKVRSACLHRPLLCFLQGLLRGKHLQAI